jgi:hypothetical protein
MRWILILVAVSACSKRNQAVCCETADECAAIGTSEVVACQIGVCVEHECIERGPCDGNEDCELPQTCVSSECTSPPAPPDAPLKPAFDIVYPNVWRFSVTIQPFPLDLIIVNTDVSPLSMTTLQVKSVADDHPTAFLRFVAAPSSADITPGFAGGKIIPNGVPILSGLIPEPRMDTESIYVQFEIVDAPKGTYDIKADAMLALDGTDFPVNLTIHMQDSQTVFADPEEGVRVPVFRE